MAFVTPYVAVFVAFVIYPIGYGLWLGSDPASYRALFSDPVYPRTVVNTLLYLLFGAPDLSFTQFMVETLSVVMFALVMVWLRVDGHQRRAMRVAIRDALLAALCGFAILLLLLKILERPLDGRLGAFFADHAATLAHGRNIVNVILVDFRGLDTLGEISVVMAAGVAVLALLAGARAASPRIKLDAPPPPTAAPAEQQAAP